MIVTPTQQLSIKLIKYVGYYKPMIGSPLLSDKKPAGVLLKHDIPKCGYSWRYRGKLQWACCPNCRTHINVERFGVYEGENQ